MNQAYLHLLINHVSILGIFFSFILLSGGMIFKSFDVKKAAMVGFVFSGIATLVVFKTGEGAEEAVEIFAGVREAAIEEHEESAEGVIWLAGGLAVISLAGLFLSLKKKAVPGALLALLLIAGAATSGWLVQVGRLGGLIRHTEIGTQASDMLPDSPEEHEEKENH